MQVSPTNSEGTRNVTVHPSFPLPKGTGMTGERLQEKQESGTKFEIGPIQEDRTNLVSKLKERKHAT